jgi:membrane protein involved in D-alanine export
MTPYAGFLYFGVLLYPLVPTLALGLLGRAAWRWALIATLGMLIVQYWSPLTIRGNLAVRELWLVAAWGLFQLLVVWTYRFVAQRTRRRLAFYAAIALSLLPLVLAKLLPVVQPGTQLGFLGISYTTFRALDVVFGIRDNLIASLSPLQLFGYLLFFPTISSGPIDRFRRFVVDWSHRRSRAEFLQDLDGALHRVFTGFLYKFILAALIKTHWLDPAAAGSDPLSTVSYMYAYSFYLFFDFAGYSCFAIGISYLFGIHTPENFTRPFLARDIRDFWNRWHLTLSHWLRDHVYMRFVLTATRGRWFRNRYRASQLGFFLSFGLMGLWHGVEPHYLLYGLYHATLVTGHEWFDRFNRRHHLWREGPLWTAAGVFLTFHAVCAGFLLFSGRLGG